MDPDSGKMELGELIKTLLKEKSLSMRRLSLVTEIDTATISRISSGKQRAKPEHLQRIASVLEVEPQVLFEAAGYLASSEQTKSKTDMIHSLEMFQSILGSTELVDPEITLDRIENELTKYEQYAQTQEGYEIILRDFDSKMNQVRGAGPLIEQLNNLYDRFCSSDARSSEKALLGSALLYFILSADIIPDYMFPIGYIDDAIAVQLVLNRLSQLNSSEQMDTE